MKKLFCILIYISFCLLSGCQQAELLGADEGLVQEIKEIQMKEKESEQTQESDMEKDQEHVFLNLDELERYGVRLATVLEISSEELEERAKDETQKNYVTVVQEFMEQKLKKKVWFLNTIPGTYNLREMVVGTTDGEIYWLELAKWYSYNEIWTVRSHSRYDEAEERVVPRSQSVEYEILGTEDIEVAVREQLEQKLANEAPGYTYFYVDETLYALMMAAEGETVELLAISGDPHSIRIEYANGTAGYREIYGENPYVLIRIDSPVVDLYFKKYSSVETGDIRLNMF